MRPQNGIGIVWCIAVEGALGQNVRDTLGQAKSIVYVTEENRGVKGLYLQSNT